MEKNTQSNKMKALICDSLEFQTKLDAQENYCRTNNVPCFILPGLKCHNCNTNFWEYLTLEEYSNQLITGCPCCGWSWCE